MPRQLTFAPLQRALDAYDGTEGTFDGDPKNPATKAWRWVERAALVTAMEANAALQKAGIIGEDGKLTPKGIELLVVRPGLTLEQIATIPAA